MKLCTAQECGSAQLQSGRCDSDPFPRWSAPQPLTLAQVSLEIGTPWMSHSRLGCPTPWISKAFKETSCPRGCLDNSLSLGCLLPPLDILCPLVKQGGVGCLTRVDIPLKHWMSKRLGYPTLYWMSKHAGYPTVVPDVQACGLSHHAVGHLNVLNIQPINSSIFWRSTGTHRSRF